MSTPTRPPQYDPQSLLNSQPVIITVIDPITYRVQFQNQTGLRKFGDITDTPCYQTIASCPAPCAFCKMPEALRSGEITQNEVELPDNRFLLVQWSKTVTSSGLEHVIETITDISEKKRMERALQQVQKMEAIGRLAGGIAHDFNNLLTVINGYSQILSEELAGHPSGKSLDLIKQAGNRAAALTKKILSFSRHHVFEQKPVQLNLIIRDIVDLLKSLIGEHIKLVVSVDPDAGKVLADPVQMEQVILNLLVNARDAMPEGGVISLETMNAELDDTYVRQHPGSVAGQYVVLTVRDTGCGMDAETQAHMFEPFFTTKQQGQGSGLGLATSYGIVKQYNGYIEVSSSPGCGSIFKIFLPKVEGIASETSITNAPETKAESKKTILLAEDETAVRALLARILSEKGYEVIEASDGMEALKLMQQHAGSCHLVIADVIMPRLNGPALAQHLSALSPAVKILYISGYTGDTAFSNGVGKDAFLLQKPILPQALTDKVEEILCNP